MKKGWRMVRKCHDCPFATAGAGLHLRRSLRAGRWREILRALRGGGHFLCHETTDETGNGSNLICAGAIEWQAKHGCTADLVQVCERLEAWRKVGR